MLTTLRRKREAELMQSSDTYRQGMKVRSTKELQLFEGMFLAQAHKGETDLSM